MFSQVFKAQIGKLSMAVRQQTGNNDGQQIATLGLTYKFDQDIALELGGAAPGLLELMGIDHGDGASLGKTPLKLNAKGVNVRLSLGDKKTHVIAETTALSATVSPPSVKSQEPTLEATISFKPSKADLVMAKDNQGRLIGTKMDRQQLALPMSGKDDKDAEATA